MFNLKEDLSTVGRNLLADGNALIKQQREDLLVDVENRARTLSDEALTRFGKIMILSAGMVTVGLLAVAAALVFGK